MPYARPWLVSIGALAWSLVCAQAWAQDVGHSAAGLALARQICSECHDIEKTPVRAPNPVAPGFETIANVPGMTGAALSAAMHRSHVTMPNVILNADELSNIVAYILSLRRTN